MSFNYGDNPTIRVTGYVIPHFPRGNNLAPALEDHVACHRNCVIESNVEIREPEGTKP